MLKIPYYKLWSVFDIKDAENSLLELEKEIQDPNFWDNSTYAQGIMKKATTFRNEIEYWYSFLHKIQETRELAELEDESLYDDLDYETEGIEVEVEKRSFTAMLSGKYDSDDAILAIHAGAGGTDSQDWTDMLMRMYLRWAETRNFETEVMDITMGEEAGVKSVTLSVKGHYAYGYLRSEKGVHRLVRLSPFDSAHRRHTSFALVEVLPQIAFDNPEIQIDPKDLKIDVFKSSGAGGQNVQKTSTAIRITHIPSGLVVTCQNERSQTQNRENAMKVLMARLVEIQQAEKSDEIAILRGEYTKAEWGSQIRSYVLHPYQIVKDHRTDYEIGNAHAVLNGDLDGFMEAYLRQGV
jgi:peptide chain release factor 2